MKKKILCFILGITLSFSLVGCGNKDIWDTNNTFDTAIIDLHNEVITVEIKQWRDFDDGEQLQIVAKDGTVYLTSSYNCTLIRSK